MAPWLIGKALSPFFVLLVTWLIGRPATRWVERHMPAGRLKRFLLIHSERNKLAYGIAAWTAVVLVLAMCVAFSLAVR